MFSENDGSSGVRSASFSPETAQLLLELLDRAQSNLAPLSKAESPNQNRSLSIGEFARLSTEIQDSVRSGDAVRAATVCLELAGWAERNQDLELAGEYADIACRLDSHVAAAPYIAGKVARLRADYESAERLFQQALDIGQAGADWGTVALVYAGLGNLYRQKGLLQDAEAEQMRSLAVALKHKIISLQGDGFHNLAVISFERGRADKGVSYARQALDAFGTRRRRIAGLANDLAYAWLTCAHAPDRALGVFREVRRVLQEPAELALVVANIAHASGKIGDQSQFDSAASDVERYLRMTPHEQNHGSALLDLAHGAAGLGRWLEARGYADRSREVAFRRKEGHAVMQAGFFLRHLDRRDPIAYRSAGDGTGFNDARVNDLVYELMDALR